MADQSVCSGRWPPQLINEALYETWKKDVKIWCALTDIPAAKIALAIHLSLSGRARTVSSEISIEDLQKDTGVNTLLTKLDEVFLLDKGRRQFSSFQNLYNLRRQGDSSVSDYVTEFEHKYYEFTQQDMKLPDPVMAFMLLASCGLTDSETQLVMSAITDVTYDRMKATIKRVFDKDIGSFHSGQNSTIVKTEPVFYSEAHNINNEVMYTSRLSRRGKMAEAGKSRGRQFSRGMTRAGNMVPSRFLTGSNLEQTGAKPKERKQNPMGLDGKISRCLICESTLHWARNCPHSYEKMGEVANDNESNDDLVYLSLFMGFAGQSSDCVKLNNLVRESQGCAVLDTGCSTTVCGTQWLKMYMDSLDDFERQQVTESPSSATFTFGDGTTIKSVKKLTLPCWIAGIRATLSTDVVDCNIPLLLSKQSMKKAKMCLNFGEDIATVGAHTIKLKCSSSGHYVIPLSL